MTLNDSAAGVLVVDALQYSRPERARFEEWRRGGVGCVHVTVAIWESARETLSTIGCWQRLLAENADIIALATDADAIERITASGRTAVVFGFQDTSPFEDDIELFGAFHALGVRIVQLTYNVQNRIGSGCWESEDGGLSGYFGRNAIAEMNRLGMLIDLSHCNERTSLEAIDASSRPVAVTHANPSEFVGTDIELKRRNKSTELIRRLAERGGVIGLSMYPKIMRGGSGASLDDFLDMMSWTVDLVGDRAVALGTDYYTGWPESVLMWWRAGRWSRESAVPIRGFSDWPAWFRSPEDFPALLDAMARRGFSGEEIRRIAGANWLRLFRESFSPA
jgi:microsomal dipeptidase-like Zn-dependent dipeptidase